MKSTWTRSELTYCTNAHPGENLQSVSGVITGPLSSVRQRRGLSRMASGLWLSNISSHQLSGSESISRFAKLLKQQGINLFTLNGFPAQGFHAEQVKEAVYQPDWSEPERVQYTLRLARILAQLLPAGVSEGTISSVPLGFQPAWNQQRNNLALDALGKCLIGLETIHREYGCRIRLCLEMEPGCVLESTRQLIDFFSVELPRHFEKSGLSSQLIQNYLGCCFDVCHQAVMFEDIYSSLQSIRGAGIHIGKIQLSSALQIKKPSDNDAQHDLAGFIEQKYLHQSRCKKADGKVLAVMDLDQAFRVFPTDSPWRTHFHVPIQAEKLIADGLSTTQHEICRTLDFLRDYPDIHPHLEVETYTWTVLPAQIRPDNEDRLVDGLTAELNWLESQMQSRSLLAENKP